MYITVIDGKRPPYQVDLLSFGKSKISFGRNPDCDIVLHAEYVSRLHGYFNIQGDKCFIEDCQSTNGLICSDKRIEKKELSESASVYIKGKNRHPEKEVRFMYSRFAPEKKKASVPMRQEAPVRFVDKEKVVEKKVFSPAGKAALIVMAVAMCITLVAAVIMPNAPKKLKGEYAFTEDDYDQTTTLIFDDGTWTVYENIPGANRDELRMAGTYTIENNIIIMKSIGGDYFTFLFDSKHNQLAQDENIYECVNKKTNAELSLDEDYMENIQDKAEKAAENACKSIGYDQAEEDISTDYLICLDDLKKPSTDFKEAFAEEMDYENDETLQVLLEDGMIYFEFYADAESEEIMVYVEDGAY